MSNLHVRLLVCDVDREAERLRGPGVEVFDGPHDERGWGLRVAHVRDPDGNLLELVRPLARERWSDWLRGADARYAAASGEGSRP